MSIIRSKRVMTLVFVVGLSVLAVAPAGGASHPDQVLLPDTEYPVDYYGTRVAASDGTLMVGFSHEGPPWTIFGPTPFDAEIIHIYGWSGNAWVEQQRLVEPWPQWLLEPGPTWPTGDEYGFSLDGDWLAIGRSSAELAGFACGSVDVYQRVSGFWAKSQTLWPTECSDYQEFGRYVAVSGGRLAVSDRNDIFVYGLEGSSWSLNGSDPHGGSVGSLALDGGLLAASWIATGDSDFRGPGVLIYDLTSGQVADPVLLVPSDVTGNPATDPLNACASLALEGSRIALGCRDSLNFGAVFLFELVQGAWKETAILTPNNEFGSFGFTVDLDGERVLVGAPFWFGTAMDATEVYLGAAYLYSLIDDSWVLSGFYQGAGPAGGADASALGWSVAIDGDVLFLGDSGYSRTGMVAVYDAPTGRFSDDESSVFQNAIEWLASEGITQGCNPPRNTQFCPDDFVTRGQMAAFLVRAMGYTDNGGGNLFTDDDGHLFENAIDKLGAAKVTQGCNPPANDKFCPDEFVTRGQMAAFLKRALS